MNRMDIKLAEFCKAAEDHGWSLIERHDHFIHHDAKGVVVRIKVTDRELLYQRKEPLSKEEQKTTLRRTKWKTIEACPILKAVPTFGPAQGEVTFGSARTSSEIKK